MRIDVDKSTEEALNRLVASGRFDSYEEAVTAAVTSFEHVELDETRKWAQLHRKLDEGLASGYAEDGVMERIIQKLREGVPLRESTQ